MWSRQLDSPSASPGAPQSVSGRGWSREHSGRASHPSTALNDPACRKGNILHLKVFFIPFFLPHPAVSKKSWKDGVWEMQGEPALMMRTGRSSPCALCSGKGAPGAHPGLVGNRVMDFRVPCPYSGQSPVPSWPSLPPWLCHSAAASLMWEGPLVCLGSVL